MSMQRSDTYLKDMLDMSEIAKDGEKQSEIVKFFSGQNILITGGSGFVGKLLIEKLLRTCPNIAKLYIFMRPKKGKSTEERFKEHFEDTVYDRLKKEQPDYAEKAVMIESDTAFIDLGLSPESKKLIQNTNIIFHGAATVRFDEKLRVATNINVRGTKQLLLLAKQMPNLKVFVHISTAFSHCVTKFIEEKFYRTPIETEKLLALLDIFDDTTLESFTPTILGKFPNTYAFTKAVAEDTVREYSTGMASCIIRPSIVIATADEPGPGWINNMYGPTGVVVGAGIGLLRSLYCIPENVADIIPADYVIANIIAAAWDTAQNGKSVLWHDGTTDTADGGKTNNCSSKTAESKDSNLTKSEPEASKIDTNDYRSHDDNQTIPIYNTVSSCQRPITWGEFMKLNEINGMHVPSDMVLWYYMFTLNRYLLVHNIYIFFLHLIPGAMVDFLALVTGRKPMLLSAYRKIHKFSGVISYFSTQQWKFRNDNVLKLWGKLNSVDRELFNFNLNNLNWNDYFYFHIRGLRIYLLKDPIETLEKGRIKYARLQYAHYTIVTICLIFLTWCAFTILKYMIYWLT